MRRCENSTGESKFLATAVVAAGMTLVIPGSHLPSMRPERLTGSPPVTELFT
jgi:hypothetical protein